MSLVRAMESVPRRFFSPFCASLLIGVRAYITEAGEDKRLSHIRALRRTVLEEQPPRAREVRGRPAHDLAEARERFQAGSERRPRLMGQSWRRHGRIVRGDVGRVAD